MHHCRIQERKPGKRFHEIKKTFLYVTKIVSAFPHFFSDRLCLTLDCHVRYSNTENQDLLKNRHASVIASNGHKKNKLTHFLDNKLSKYIQNFDRRKWLIYRQDRLEMIKKMRYIGFGVFFS